MKPKKLMIMEGQFVIIDLKNMDFMKNKEGEINYYDTMEDACATCGMYDYIDFAHQIQGGMHARV